MAVTNPFTDNQVTTTDGTATLIESIAIPAASIVGLNVDIVAFEAATDDTARFYETVSFKNISGVVTQIGSVIRLARVREDLDWEVSYAVSGSNVQVKVQGEAGKTILWKSRIWTTPPDSDEPSSSNRVSGTDVKEIFETDLTAAEIEPFIIPANKLITEILGSEGISDDILTEIERYLAAHFASSYDQRVVSEKIGDMGVQYQFTGAKGIHSTDYGQRAILLDYTGNLARMGKTKAKFFTTGVSIDKRTV